MGWKIGGAISAILAVVAALVTLTTASEYKTGIEWVIAVIFAVLAILCFWRAMKASAAKKAKLAANQTFMTDQDLEQIQAGGLPVLTGVPVILADGEAAHFFGPARRYITKTKAVGRTGSGSGVSVRVAKGVSVSTGGGSSRTVYGEVTDTYSGAIVLTNRRIVFIHNQAGFECKISALTAMTPVDGSVVVQAGSKTYQFSVARQDLFVSALSMVTGK